MIGPRTIFVLLVCLSWNCLQSTQAQSLTGINVPEGFEVTKVAGDDLATNVYSLAVSPKGEIFVSGPGYIRVLIDSNSDGVFDSTRQFADAPRSGAQGMCFDGNDLLCTGDGGLLRFADSNADGIADGPPKKVLAIKTGGEHDAHAIRKGPDGWWYLLAGNGVPILPEYHAGKNSPVTAPRAGFLMRISPDWTEKEIFAHGFRNAYDFDFNSLGQIFVYDSDGERDITLPWYRPTRVYQMRPGDDAGWVARGWKRPSSYLDMPIQIGALGRGSPTGVIVSSSLQFPASFDDAVFVADWTFGRVIAFRQDLKTGEFDRGSDFAVANGQFGFAVTDLDFATDGSLLVSAGGRGTQGAVYRITYLGDVGKIPKALSRSRMFLKQTKSEKLGGEELISALSGPSLPARAAALEALVGRRDIWGDDAELNPVLVNAMVIGFRKSLGVFEPKTAGLVLRIANELDPSLVTQIDHPSLPVESRLVLQLSAARSGESKRRLIEVVAKQLATGQGDLESISRIGQLALGGCGQENADEMFVGYTAKIPVSFSPAQLGSISFYLAESLQLAGSEETGRLAALIGGGSSKLLESIAMQIGVADSSVPEDIHWLNCLSRSADEKAGLTKSVQARVALVLVGIGSRLKSEKLNVDRNFFPRMKGLAQRLFQLGGRELATQVAMTVSGEDNQVFLVDVMPESVRGIAIERFAARVQQHPDEATVAQIQVLASHSSDKYLPVIRKFGSRPELQDAVIRALSKSAAPEDRPLFVRGLKSPNEGTVKSSAAALNRISDVSDPDSLFFALLAARRMGWDKSSVAVRDELISLLRKRTGQDFGYQPKQKGLDQNDVLHEWARWIQKKYPREFAEAFHDPDSRVFAKRIESVDWAAGDAERGKQLYKTLQCAQCHDGGTRLGPRLEGITKRFGRDDLLRSIATPSDQVPDRYRAMLVETVDGQFFRGSVVYESVDGVTLQEAGGSTVRLNREDIESKTLSEKSLMPEGLLKDVDDLGWADLYAFLKSL